jgi:hypothetical protein
MLGFLGEALDRDRSVTRSSGYLSSPSITCAGANTPKRASELQVTRSFAINSTVVPLSPIAFSVGPGTLRHQKPRGLTGPRLLDKWRRQKIFGASACTATVGMPVRA